MLHCFHERNKTFVMYEELGMVELPVVIPALGMTQ